MTPAGASNPVVNFPPTQSAHDTGMALGPETGYELLIKTYDAMYYSAIMKRKALIGQRKMKLDH